MGKEKGFLDDFEGFLKSSFKDAVNAVGDSLETLKSAPKVVTKPIVDHVETEGMTGKAAENLSGRAKQIRDAENRALGM